MKCARTVLVPTLVNAAMATEGKERNALKDIKVKRRRKNPRKKILKKELDKENTFLSLI